MGQASWKAHDKVHYNKEELTTHKFQVCSMIFNPLFGFAKLVMFDILL